MARLRHSPPADGTAEAKKRPQQSEFRKNTVATWVWAQANLLTSVVTVPLFTRLLSRPEYGLWLQLLSLSVLATIADLGLGSVFVRRLAGHEPADRERMIAAAFAFYGVSTALLTLVLLAVVATPAGLIEPYITDAVHPALTGCLVIAAISINLVVMPYTIALQSRGQLARERWYGAAPGVFGTIATVGAAVVYHTAFSMALVYLVVEAGFDAALVIQTRFPMTLRRIERTLWRSLAKESWAVLVISTVPQLVFTVDAVIVGRVVGGAFVAVYGVAQKGGDMIRRFFQPMTDSLFNAFCRAGDEETGGVRRASLLLPWVSGAGGAAVMALAIALSARLTTLLFGGSYAKAAAPLALLILAATVRAMLTPQIRRLQAHAKLGRVPLGILIGFSVHVALAIELTRLYSISGTATAVLIGVICIEGPNAVLGVRAGEHDTGAARLLVGQLALVGVVGAVALVSLWLRASHAEVAYVDAGLAVGFAAVGCYLMAKYYVLTGRTPVRVTR